MKWVSSPPRSGRNEGGYGNESRDRRCRRQQIRPCRADARLFEPDYLCRGAGFRGLLFGGENWLRTHIPAAPDLGPLAPKFHFAGGIVAGAAADVVASPPGGVAGSLAGAAAKRRSPTNDPLLVRQQLRRSADRRRCSPRLSAPADQRF